MADAPECRPCVAVAFSGGRDSTALLHATAHAAHEHGGLDVLALHVHHGISAHADAWAHHAQALCARWHGEGLPLRLKVQQVDLGEVAGESLEALARRARYRSLAAMAKDAGCDLVLLAHHRRDQAETFLLQALRGAGVAGLAGMPVEAVREGIRWVRPWLNYPREAIEAYIAQHELPFIDDDSNDDGRFARNRLRLGVWSALTASFPQAEAALAASAQRVADVLPGVHAWREELLAHLRPTDAPDALDAMRWAELTGSQRREVLAHWYRARCGRSLGASWLERLAHEVPGLVHRRQSAFWRPVGLGLYRGVLSVDDGWMRPDRPRPEASEWASPQAANVAMATLGPERHVSITRPGDVSLPGWGGMLRVSLATERGLPPARLSHVALRARQGGEQHQAGPGRPPRSLKKQFQSAAVPAWQRNGPLLYDDGELLFVPGLGVDARAWAPPDAPQWTLEWVPFTR